MIPLRTYSVDTVMSFLKEENDKLVAVCKNKKRARAEIDGFSVRIYSPKLKTFMFHGTKCSGCGIKATHFSLVLPTSRNTGLNLVLYAGNIIMTCDHIVPKSKGGTDKISNIQPMCYPCNQTKGSK